MELSLCGQHMPAPSGRYGNFSFMEVLYLVILDGFCEYCNFKGQ